MKAGDVCSRKQKNGLCCNVGGLLRVKELLQQGSAFSNVQWKMKLVRRSQANVLHACHLLRERPPLGHVSGAFLSPCGWWVQRGHLSCVGASVSFLLSPRGLTWQKASSPVLAALCLAPSLAAWGGNASSASAAACQDRTLKLEKEEALQSSCMGTAFSPGTSQPAWDRDHPQTPGTRSLTCAAPALSQSFALRGGGNFVLWPSPHSQMKPGRQMMTRA